MSAKGDGDRKGMCPKCGLQPGLINYLGLLCGNCQNYLLVPTEVKQRWHVGANGFTIYRDDQAVGSMDSAELAREVVAGLNGRGV